MAAAQNERIENTYTELHQEYICAPSSMVLKLKGGIQLVSWNENSEN